MSLELDICDDQNALDVDKQMIRQTVEYVVKHFCLNPVTISLAIVDDRAIQELKGRYFGETFATDVISFDLRDAANGAVETDSLDCEVVVNAQRAQRQAREKRTDPQAELNLYIMHGLLHQLGFDDATTEQSQVMHQKEDELLEQLGLGKVYSGKGS